MKIFAKLRRRLPVRLRQNWKVLAVTVAGAVIVLAVFGSVVIKPYSSSYATIADEEQITEDIAGTVDLFDDGASHEITLSYSQDDYDDMLDAYFTEGEKEWMIADITIDGTTIDSVGVRLKGNSTLSSLVDGREGSPTEGESAPRTGSGMGAGRGDPPEGMDMPEGMGLPEGMEMPEGGVMPGGGQLPQGMGDGGFSTGVPLSTDEPENLPLLVSFDEYQEGRAYQGVTQLSIRPASSSYVSSLNEAVALEATAAAGQPTQEYSFTTYAVNDRPVTTRLVVESPDAQYATNLDGEGVLFKVLASSSFSYQGGDQTEYTDDFKQVNMRGSQDLQPIISFLEWLDGADEKEFVAELDQWIDVEALADYLALQDVIGNGDTLSGPGRNGYLYYDLNSGLISVVSWDLNLALGGMSFGGAAITDQVPGAGAQMPGAGDQLPGGGADIPDGVEDMLGGGNELISQFTANPEFADKVEAATAQLRSSLVDDGAVDDIIDQVAAEIPVTEGLSKETIEADVETARSYFATE